MRRARSLRLVQVALVGAVLGALLLLSACGGDSQLQQQASSVYLNFNKKSNMPEALGCQTQN